MAKAQAGKAGGIKSSRQKRVVKVDSYGDAHIVASFNNIIISLTNKQGRVISWSVPVKWVSVAVKKTPVRSPDGWVRMRLNCSGCRFEKADVFVKGPGSGREGASVLYLKTVLKW